MSSRAPASPPSTLPSPFALLVDPEAIHAAVRRGDAMGLKRRICRPLDRPSHGSLVGRLGAELSVFEADLEAEELEQCEATLDDIAVQALPIESVEVVPPAPVDPDDMQDDDDEDDDDDDEEVRR